MVNNMKFSILCVLLLGGTSMPGASSASDVLYPFGPNEGDTTNVKSDDGSSPAINIKTVFHFFDTVYSSIYVDNNGLVSFGEPVSDFISQPFPAANGKAFVAAFWADINNAAAGDIYYRETTNLTTLHQATQDINLYFPVIPFMANWVFIATWDRVAYYGSQSSLVNTFQVVLISDGNRAFIVLNYGEINWASSGNQYTGLGGNPAQAGYNYGDSTHYFSIPDSRTNDILNVGSTTNVGRPGRWVFRVDNFQVAGVCAYNDTFFFNYGDIFWLENNCRTKCQCNNNGNVSCVPQPCGLPQSCTAMPSFYTCKLLQTGICSAIGDSHYVTFDGRFYDFQSTCTYVLSQLCLRDRGLEYYSVEAKSEDLGGTQVAWTRMVYVSAFGSNVTMKAGSFGNILVDGITVNLPVSLRNGNMIVHQIGAYVTLETIFGLTVAYDLRSSVVITLPPGYSSQVCGLCGNYNGVKDDDFTLRDGSLVSNPYSFAVDWISGDVTSCSHVYDLAPVCGSNVIATSYLTCGIIQNTTGPFASCHSQIPPGPFFTLCLFDQCDAGGAKNALCQSIQLYAASCQASLVNISDWRSDLSCGMNTEEIEDDPESVLRRLNQKITEEKGNEKVLSVLCTKMSCSYMPNSHYELCGKACQASCPTTVLSTPSCDITCVEGCFCDAGYLRSGDSCVPEAQCGCEYQGIYYNVGDRVWLSGCSQRCTCESTSNVVCLSASCNSNQQCGIKDGKLGCQEILTTCSVFGDPHYVTFDGVLVHFQGSCAYQVAHTCDSAADTRFQVVAENRHRGNPTVTFVYQVDFWFKDSNMNVHVSVQGSTVQVNTVPTVLPTNIGSVVSISNVDGGVLIQSPLVAIYYDGDNTLLVKADAVNQNKLCGMCGNFNGDPNDDRLKPDGSTAWSDQEFGNSWQDSGSPAGCTDNVQSRLTGTSVTVAESENLCGIINDSSGPFAECHWFKNPDPFYASCVYDLTNYGLANGMLCRAMESYEKICKTAGVQIPEWRPTPQCPLPDPCDNIICASNEWCGENKEDYGCLCYDTFLNQAKPNYDLTVTCDGSNSSVSMATCMLFGVNFPAEILHLADPACTGNLVGGRVDFPFGSMATSCGSQLKVNGTHAIYSNVIRGDYIKQSGPIILHEDIINIQFSCAYPLKMDVSFLWAINTVENVINVTLPDGLGTFRTSMMLYKDALYNEENNDIPVKLMLGQKAFFSVRVANLNTNQFVVILSSCWATDSADPLSSVRWDLILNQCPVPQDRSVVIIEDGVSDEGNFSFDVFKFIGNSNLVFIHCQIGICNRPEGPCTRSCAGKANLANDTHTYVSKSAVSRGPIILQTSNDSGGTITQASANGGSPGPANPLFALLLISCLVIFAN